MAPYLHRLILLKSVRGLAAMPESTHATETTWKSSSWQTQNARCWESKEDAAVQGPPEHTGAYSGWQQSPEEIATWDKGWNTEWKTKVGKEEGGAGKKDWDAEWKKTNGQETTRKNNKERHHNASYILRYLHRLTKA